MAWNVRALVMAIVLAAPAVAQAQQYKSWDTAASYGFGWGDDGRPDEPYSYGEPNIVFRIDAGRYWGPHLKVEAGAVLTPDRSYYGYDPLGALGASGAYALVLKQRSTVGGSASVAYQFFENEMMHPFVSAGVRVTHETENRFRNPQTVVVNRVTYTVDAAGAQTTDTLIRPYGSIGCKSYFNERTFLRSDLSIAVGPRGFSHATVTLGFGVDF